MAFDLEQAGNKLGELVRNNSSGLVVGGLLGVVTGGPLGLVLGGAAGVMVNRAFNKAKRQYNPKAVFFRATFTVMGKLAKADGQVSENEIAFARTVMEQMRLDEYRTREAMDLFNQGKDPDYDIAEVLRPLAVLLRNQPNVRMVFVEIQLQAAMADGQVSEAEMMVVRDVCAQLRMSSQEVMELIARMQAQFNFHQHNQQPGGFNTEALLSEAYAVLGVGAEATDAEVKKAYRRLMSQHHPDKLVSKGLPEEMQQLAKEKTQDIQSAYERIKQARGMR